MTLHFNAFPPPDGLDKNLLVSFVQMVSYKKMSIFNIFAWRLGFNFFFFSEVEKFSLVSNTLIIIILTVK